MLGQLSRVKGGTFQRKLQTLTTIPFSSEESSIAPQILLERWGLGALAAVAIGSTFTPILIPQLLPQWLKTGLLTVGVGSSIAFTIATDSARTRQGIYSTLKRTQVQDVRDRLQAEAAYYESKTKIEGQVRMLTLIMQLPESMQQHYLHEYGLQGLVAPPPAPATPPTVYPDAIPVQSIAVLDEPQRSRPASAALPDGAELIDITDIGNINKYSVIMAIAGMGDGKTATISYILQRLEGVRVFVSPDAKQESYTVFEKVFGAYGDYGTSDSEVRLDESDLSNSDRTGSICSFLWRLYREIRNRQQLEKAEIDQLPIYRCFFDEMAATFSSFEENEKDLMQLSNKETFFNARKHRCQLFYGAQSESVDILGLKGLSAARNDMWHLYPGKSAIATAIKHDRPQLAAWFKDRAAKGYAIALLEKQGVFFHAIDLPLLPVLEGKTPAPTTDPEADWLEEMKQWQASGGSLEPVAVRAKWEAVTGRTLNDRGLQLLTDNLKAG